MKAVIYKFENKINNKIYIGQSRCERTRYFGHVNCKNPVYEIDRAIQKYGIENFNYDIICSYTSDNLDDINNWMDENEVYYISYYNSLHPNGYNLLSGGNHPEFSDITRQRISYACSGELNGFFNKTHSEETRKKMSESAKKRGMNNLYVARQYRCIDYYYDNKLIKTFSSKKEAIDYFRENFKFGVKILNKIIKNEQVNGELSKIKLIIRNDVKLPRRKLKEPITHTIKVNYYKDNILLQTFNSIKDAFNYLTKNKILSQGAFYNLLNNKPINYDKDKRNKQYIGIRLERI